MNEEIALFIDFENIRYSLLNVRHREPDPQELIGVARHFGTVMVARAYADWTRQPDFFKGSLTAAMIDRVDCPAKLRDRFRNNGPNPAYTYNAYGPSAIPRPYEPDQGDEPEDELMDDARGAEMETADHDLRDEGDVSDEADGAADGQDGEALDGEALEDDYQNEGDEAPQRYEPANHRPYIPGPQYHNGPNPNVTAQSTVDLNMLMDIIETVFDRPSINTYVLMTGDRDFTRICARLKLRLNKHVIVVGIPGTVSRDLIAAANQFIPLGGPMNFNQRGPMRQDYLPQGPVDPEEPGFIQFLDYIDTHWAWRTIGGVANFIGDPFNPKNRFRGRLTRDTARDLLRECLDRNILLMGTDQQGGESLQLNRDHPAVQAVLNEQPAQ
ncbi:MAG TPA: NYN domain-containing protein [Ktedonobacterales bacterium]